jgi:protein pelota
VEKGEADLYIVRESGIESVSALSENVPGKLYEDDSGGDFHQKVAQVLERTAKRVDHVVLAGPGFEKQHVESSLSEETKSKTFMQDTSVTGRTGLNEAIKRGALKNVVRSSRIDEESAAVEEFFDALQGSGEADYGDPVKDLAEKGAVEKLLLTVERFREEQELVKNVTRSGGEVVKVHADHEAGERLEKLGGIGAILRYRPD